MDEGLPRRLIARQFPQWAHLPMARFESSGTDNHVFRLGADLCVRMPKAAWAADAVARECVALPRFRDLPLAIPKTVARGEPDELYPHVWAVCEWIEGEAAGFDALANPIHAARDLAAFISALRGHDAMGGPRSAKDNNLRGEPLRFRDNQTRRAIANLAAETGIVRLLKIWDAALAAKPYTGPGLWIHSDLKEGNLLMRDGRLIAVIDFGMVAVGDPAVDLNPAWSFFDGPSRDVFLAEMKADADTLARAKGWAISAAATAWDYYRERNPILTRISQRTIATILQHTDG